MISPDCDFKVFIDTMKGKDPLMVVYMAEQEATRAERHMLQASFPKNGRRCGKEYAELLKGLINYLRYSIKPNLPKGHIYLKIISPDNLIMH